LKQAGNYEQAIQCYKRAIEALPESPEPYLESGRMHVKLKQYPKALRRFKEASEIARDLPTPNQEIGIMRVLQVRELIEQGYSPQSSGIEEFLNEAADHFEISLDKASRIKPLHADDDPDRPEKAVLEVANEIFKTNLAELLGTDHPIAQKIDALVTSAIFKASKDARQGLEPLRLISTAWYMFNSGQTGEAENFLFQAAKSEEYFEQACREINIMGTLLRVRQGPDQAIWLYERLLDLKPPNRAPINFNLAVAWRQKKDLAEAAGALVEAVFLEPNLPQDDNFRQQTEMVSLLETTRELFSRIERNLGGFQVPVKLRKHYRLLGAMENLIACGHERATLLLEELIQKNPEFFARPEFYSSKLITDFVADILNQVQNSPQSEEPDYIRFLSAVLKRKESLRPEPNLAAFNKYRHLALTCLKQTGDQAKAAGLLAKAIISFPEYLDRPGFYANRTLVNLARKINRQLSGSSLSG
ncbi:MAG: tetratricopeptide repeat protein, partial [Deltaproteobacteria bacterium]|nr:tetratricopeptide repeat protein [Deltaproteobacteria bacterium]